MSYNVYIHIHPPPHTISTHLNYGSVSHLVGYRKCDEIHGVYFEDFLNVDFLAPPVFRYGNFAQESVGEHAKSVHTWDIWEEKTFKDW